MKCFHFFFFFLEKVRIYNDGFDPLDADEVKEWEKEKNLERTSNLFEFFFQHKSKGGKTENDHSTPFEDLFRSFSSENPTRFRDQKTFEQQFKNSKEYAAAQERIKQAEEQKRQEEILKQQQQELQRHQEILRRQEEEQIRLETILKQQEEERQRAILQRQKEELERQERARQQKIEEERRREEQARRQQQAKHHYNQPHQTRSPHDPRYANSEKEYASQDPHRSHSNSYTRANNAHDRGSYSNIPDEQYAYDQWQRQGNQGVNQAYDGRYKSQHYTNRENQPRNSYAHEQRASSDPYSKPQDKRKYTKGTDGRWYYKGNDGRWKLRDDSYSDDRKRRPTSANTQSTSSDSYTDKDGKVYVRGNDGNWYMRVDSPSTSRSQERSQHRTQSHQRTTDSYQHQQERQNADRFSQQRHTDSAHILPRGLFRNDRGQISDRIGNLYERMQDGRYRVVLSAAAAKERLKEQLRSHKQADLLRHHRDPNPPQTPPKQQIYHDATGSVYVKDSHGNLIKVKPGQQERTPSDPNSGYSYRDPDVARQQKRWHRPSQEQTYQQPSQHQFQQHSYHSQDQAHTYSQKQRYQQQSYHNHPIHEEL